MVEKTTTESNLENFKKLVRKAIYLSHHEEVYFNAIPNEKWMSIFEKNFNSNFKYAQRVILNKFKEIENNDMKRVDLEKNKIFNLEKATNKVLDAINSNEPILFITDFDNDGSLAQAIINEYLKIDEPASKNMHVEYAQVLNGNSNRGFTVDLVEKLAQHKNIDQNAKFLIVTADNGINSRDEQYKIHEKFPNATIIVTDHHNPDPELVIEENEKAIIFNPHYNPTEFFQKFNISGANTCGVLMKNILTKRYSKEELEKHKIRLENITKLCKVSNLLDYVETDPADKPEKDYVITKFLQLQPLLNINNSISKIITGEIPVLAIQAIKAKIPNLDVDLIYKEAKNIHIQNNIAKCLLNVYEKNKKKNELNATDFYSLFLAEMHNMDQFNDGINPNYIEQLRPHIFGLTADDSKTEFLDALNERMIAVFESVKISEKAMATALRNGEVVTKNKLEHSVIAYADPNILSVFNRKFLNKVYNDENPGFSLTLDSIGKAKVSGSFRSLYNISSILKNKIELEKELNVKIDTPGHEKAAGFVVKSLSPETNPITEETIDKINKFINASIAELKEKELKSKETYLLTDLEAIQLIDRINRAVRGNIAHFDRITPLLKLTSDTIWTDAYTTEQYSMYEIVSNKKYGYITINMNFHGDTVIVPVELIRKIVKSGYKDYLNLNYMDGGIFMAEKVIAEKDIYNIIDLRNKNTKSQEIAKVFEKDFKDKNFVTLSREQIKDNPFFKYHDYGRLNFDLFERMVIGLIDSNKIESLVVFDVEANGFGNSKLMNFGSMNYSINEKSGQTIQKDDFLNKFYYTQRGEEYLLNDDQIASLREISAKEKEEMPLSLQKMILIKNHLSDSDNTIKYYISSEVEDLINKKTKKKKSIPFLLVKNYIDNKDGTITFNREIHATMLAYLVKDRDFKVPQEMTNLTGITQKILQKYGKLTHEVDTELTEFYKDKNVMFGAHNTPYDARVLRVNTPNFYKILRKSKIYDSALFSREQKLAYDYITVANFIDVIGLPKGIYFYNNAYSDFNIKNFIEAEKNGYFPDRTGQYLLEIDGTDYYLVDKEKHEKIKVEATKEELLTKMNIGSIPNISVKYSVEKLSEQWMIHSLLLSDEEFHIQHVDLNKRKYSLLRKQEDALLFFQDNYHFDASPESNMMSFFEFYRGDKEVNFNEAQQEVLQEFVHEFLEQNKNIQQKFADAWMYKKVLSIKDPTRLEITNDLVELVNYQTNIPQDKIRVIFDEAIKFKEKYGIEHILQHEGHINGPWETDSKGDVAFEDKLTLSLLAQRNYNSYTHNVNSAIDMFNSYALKAKLSFDLADLLSDELAYDSYSFRQGLLYERETKSKLISGIQNKENQLKNEDGKQIVKFKLDNDILPQDTAVYAITHKGVSVPRSQIEKDKEMLSFILLNEQLLSSLGGDDSESNENSDTIIRIKEILDANKEICMDYKFDLDNRYQYVEFNKRDLQVKQLLDAAISGIRENKFKKCTVTDIDKRGFEIVEEIFDNYVNFAKDTVLKNIQQEDIDAIKNRINEFKMKAPKTRIEEIMERDDKENFKTFSELRDVNFLISIPIKRKDPLKILITKFLEQRILNKFIEVNKLNLDLGNEDILIDDLNGRPKLK